MGIASKTATLAAALVLLWLSPTRAQLPPLERAPCFFQRYLDVYSVPANLALMRQDSVSLRPHGVRSIAGFAWGCTPTGSQSWRLDMEELISLLPFIASPKREDRQFARTWFSGWDEGHTRPPATDPLGWDPMTTAIRSMVLVFLLQREQEDGGEGSVATRLREVLLQHQGFLAKRGRWDADSNHGVWEAMALVEMCRAIPDSTALSAGLERFADILVRSTSASGVHLEHSPNYHFAVLRWLDETISYLESLPGFSWERMGEMDDIRARMAGAGFYLQDHAGRMLPIGDTAALSVWPDVPAGDGGGDVLFDPESGYAVFKESRAGEGLRVVVLNIQGPDRPFAHHFHDDALALIVSFDGESILGDQGAYDYGHSQFRRFLQSAAAHNLVAPAGYVTAGSTPRDPSNHVTGAAAFDDGSVTMTALREYEAGSVHRTVAIDRIGSDVSVVDDITGADMMMLWNIGSDVARVHRVAAGAADAQEFCRVELVTRRGHEYVLSFSSPSLRAVDVRVAIVHGSRRPMMGWYSPSYGKVERSYAVSLRLAAADGARIRTSLSRTR